MALERGAAAAREQAEALVEPRHEIVGRQRAHPRRRELDRERDAVEAPAQLRRPRSTFVVGEREVGLRVARAVDEQLHRIRAPRREVASSSAGQPSDGTATICSPATPRPSRLVASTVTCGHRATRSRRRPRRRRRAGARSCRARSAAASRRGSRATTSSSGRLGLRCTPRLVATASHTTSGSVTGCELAQPRAIGEVGNHLGRDLHREARLADTAHAGQRHERPLAHRRRDVAISPRARRTSSPAAADFPGARPANAAAGTPPPDQGASSWNTRIGSREIAETVVAEIDELDAAGSDRRTSCGGRIREQHLPAVRDRHQPRAPVQRAVHVLARRAEAPLVGMQAHSRPQQARRGPSPRRASIALRVERRGHCVRRRSEHCRHAVAHRREHDAVVALDRVTQDRVVARERVRIIASGCSSHSRVEVSRSVKRNVTVPVGRVPTHETLVRHSAIRIRSSGPERHGLVCGCSHRAQPATVRGV